MVKCTEGNVEINGSAWVIMAELESLIRSVREALSEKLGEEGAMAAIDEIVKNSKLSDDEMDKELFKMFKSTMKEVLKDE